MVSIELLPYSDMLLEVLVIYESLHYVTNITLPFSFYSLMPSYSPDVVNEHAFDSKCVQIIYY